MKKTGKYGNINVYNFNRTNGGKRTHMKKLFSRVLCIALVVCMAVSAMVMPTSAANTTMKSVFDLDVSKISSTGIFFKCTTNKPDFMSYEVGDEIVFTFSMYDGANIVSAPYFHYTLVQDDGNNKDGYIDGTTGVGVVKTVLTTPGSVNLKVWPADTYRRDVNNSNYPELYSKMKSSSQQNNSDPPLAAGAIAGAPEITTAVAEPSDFDEYWAGELAKLDECAPTLRNITKLDISSSTYDYYDVEVNCIGDPNKVITGTTHVAGILTVPKGASAGSLKFALNFQGYGVTSAGKSAASGTVTFSVCAHSILQLQDSTYYDTTVSRGLLGKGNTKTDYGWSAEENATASTSYFHDMLLRDVQAIRFLKKYFGEGVQGTVGDVNTGAWAGLWNGKDIILSGGSQGGYQSIATAGLVPEVTEVSASIPWFGNIGSQTKTEKIKSGFQPPFAAGLLYLDTCYFAKRVKAQVTISAGAGDLTSPVTSVQAMYNNMTTDVSLTFDQGRTHYQSITYLIQSTQSKLLTLKPGDTYKLPFAVSSISDPSLASVSGDVLTAVADGSFKVTYTNGTTRTFNVKTPVAATGVTLDKTEETLAVD